MLTVNSVVCRHWNALSTAIIKSTVITVTAGNSSQPNHHESKTFIFIRIPMVLFCHIHSFWAVSNVVEKSVGASCTSLSVRVSPRWVIKIKCKQKDVGECVSYSRHRQMRIKSGRRRKSKKPSKIGSSVKRDKFPNCSVWKIRHGYAIQSSSHLWWTQQPTLFMNRSQILLAARTKKIHSSPFWRRNRIASSCARIKCIRIRMIWRCETSHGCRLLPCDVNTARGERVCSTSVSNPRSLSLSFRVRTPATTTSSIFCDMIRCAHGRQTGIWMSVCAVPVPVLWIGTWMRQHSFKTTTAHTRLRPRCFIACAHVIDGAAWNWMPHECTLCLCVHDSHKNKVRGKCVVSVEHCACFCRQFS